MDSMVVQSIEQKIDKAIELDSRIKKDKKELDLLKADLQAIALQEMENKSLKYKQFFGGKGSCQVAYKEKFEIDNYPLLHEILGELLDTKVVKKEEIKFDVDATFKKALIALYNGDYKDHDIRKILVGLGLDDTQIKAALKKLKGDYIKDKQVLESYGVTEDLEEELDAIKETKNYELIKRYFGDTAIEMDKFKRAIFVEESLSIGLTYDN